MSADSRSLSIISLGVSCQTSFQIRHHAGLIGRLTGETIEIEGEELEGSTFPFDWRIMAADAFCSMAEKGRFFPESPVELSNRIGQWPANLPARWDDNGSYFWHDFKLTPDTWNAEQTFDAIAAKYRYTIDKFLNRTKRSVFILSNTQNNLEAAVSDVTGLDFDFDRRMIDRVKHSLEMLFPHLQIELIVVAARHRIQGDHTKWPAQVYVIDQSNLAPDDVVGDHAQWEAVFRDFFARFPTCPKRKPDVQRALRNLRTRIRDLISAVKSSHKKSPTVAKAAPSPLSRKRS
jgi:hypothetical protein